MYRYLVKMTDGAKILETLQNQNETLIKTLQRIHTRKQPQGKLSLKDVLMTQAINFEMQCEVKEEVRSYQECLENLS